MECGGKRSATPLWIRQRVRPKSKAPSPLRYSRRTAKAECCRDYIHLEMNHVSTISCRPITLTTGAQASRLLDSARRMRGTASGDTCAPVKDRMANAGVEYME